MIREIHVTTDPTGFGIPQPIAGVLYGGEENAHKFIVSAADGTALSGTVSAKFLRLADNAVVPLTGTTSGGKAYVTLTANCYMKPGRFQLTIYVTASGSTTAVYCCSGSVAWTDGETTVDPSGEVALSVSSLIAAINAAIASVPSDYSSLLSKIANTFSNTANYKAGKYVWYNGGLYRFQVDHAAGDWDSSEVYTVVVGNQITNAYYEAIMSSGASVVAGTQAALDNYDDKYKDLDDVPPNSVVTYYLTHGLTIDNTPNFTYTDGPKGTLVTFTARGKANNQNGCVQIWTDAVEHDVYYRICWESSLTWSEWFSSLNNRAGQQIGCLRAQKYTKAVGARSMYDLDIAVGVPIYFCGLYTTVATGKNLYFNVRGWYGSGDDNELVVQYGTFTGQPIVIYPKRNFTRFRIGLIGDTDDMADSDYCMIGMNIDQNQEVYSHLGALLDTNRRAGVLNKYAARFCTVCKFHGLSGAAGDVLTVRAVKSSNHAKNYISVFGVLGPEASSGQTVALGRVNFGDVKRFRISQAFAGFQAYCEPNSGNDSIEFEVDAAVNLDPGVEKDVFEIGRLNRHTVNIFRKVVCVGDSYTSGHIQLNGGSIYATNEEYAWPRYMEKLTGNTYVNCGVSGATTITWQTAARGLAKAQSTGRVQAYIIGLMINDTGTGNPVALGTSSDIGTDNSTYYAQMSKIIRLLNGISPLAKIFVTTCPKNDPDRYDSYNQAVRDIVEAYTNTYPVHCLDLARDYYDLYNNASLTEDMTNSNHYTATGYEQFAEIYQYVISDYINNHVSDFYDVFQIPID